MAGHNGPRPAFSMPLGSNARLSDCEQRAASPGDPQTSTSAFSAAGRGPRRRCRESAPRAAVSTTAACAAGVAADAEASPAPTAARPAERSRYRARPVAMPVPVGEHRRPMCAGSQLARTTAPGPAHEDPSRVASTGRASPPPRRRHPRASQPVSRRTSPVRLRVDRRRERGEPCDKAPRRRLVSRYDLEARPARAGWRIDASRRSPERRRSGHRPSVFDAAGSGASLNVALTIAARLPNDPRHQLAEVVAGDVLHHSAARLRQRPSVSREVDADQQVARRAVAVAQRAAVVGGEHAADRGAIGERRIERQPLAVLRQRCVHVAQRWRPPRRSR